MSKSKPPVEDDEDYFSFDEVPKDGGVVFHRGIGQKHTDEDCWCSPLRLTKEQSQAHNASSMDELLDQFYQVH